TSATRSTESASVVIVERSAFWMRTSPSSRPRSNSSHARGSLSNRTLVVASNGLAISGLLNQWGMKKWPPEEIMGGPECPRLLERFTFASPTCSPQPRIHGLQMIGVFSSRVAATVHSLEAKAPGCPQATPALPRSEPQSGRQEGSATARACRPAGAGKGFFCVSPGPGADAPQAMNCRSFGAWGVYLVYFVVRSFRLPRCQWYDRAIVSAWAAH